MLAVTSDCENPSDAYERTELPGNEAEEDCKVHPVKTSTDLERSTPLEAGALDEELAELPNNEIREGCKADPEGPTEIDMDAVGDGFRLDKTPPMTDRDD